MTGLARFVGAVDARVELALEAHEGFHGDQRALLHATVGLARQGASGNPLGHPLSMLYLVARAQGREMDVQAVHIGAFCLLYVLSLDLFDDVQDDELEGKPHETAGPAIAINSALTLNFLATLELRRAMELEADPGRAMAYLELYNRVSLEAVAGQHRDLLGASGARTPQQVLAMHQAKTSCLQLLTECGALLGHCDDALRTHYRAIGERLAQFIQIRDDLRDVFGKDFSPDLATGKLTYPIACLLQDCDETTRARFAELVSELPGSMQALRTFLYRSGAVEASAAMLEELRERIHDEIALLGRASPHLRTLLDVINGLASSVYRAPPIASTVHLWSPRGGWHDDVRRELACFAERMAPHGVPTPPTLRPWHQPHWMYVPAQETLFYPDLEGLPEETLPFQAELLGTGDLTEVAAILRAQLPAVLAHEMFHRWRAVNGRLTADHWHEEWAANHLAVAYCARFDPATLATSVALAERVIARHPGILAAHESVLSRCPVESPAASGYAMDALSIAVVTLEMVRRMAESGSNLDASIRALLEARRGTALSA